MGEKNVFASMGDYFVVPSFVAERLSCASANEIKTALFFCAHPEMTVFQAENALGITKADIDAALAFWRGADKPAAKEQPAADTASRLGTPPDYNGEQLAKIVENEKSLPSILNECQRILGKTFTSHDTEVYIGSLFDWLGLSPEYILSITSYCCELGKKNVRYIEKTAISLCEQGIDDYKKLELYISDAEKRGKTEHKLRKLFGFGERALTAAEKKHFAKYCETPYKLVEYAYELMIKNIGEVKLSYMSKILDNWREKGISTIEAAMNESNATVAPTKQSGGKYSSDSFDFDDFLSAAIKNGVKKKEG